MAREYGEVQFDYELQRFVLKETGRNAEKTYLELNMPKFGKKGEINAGGFDFSSLNDLGISKTKVTDFMSKKTGKSLEQCHTELNMPIVNKFGKDSLGSFRTFSPAQMLSMRGFDCHLR